MLEMTLGLPLLPTVKSARKSDLARRRNTSSRTTCVSLRRVEARLQPGALPRQFPPQLNHVVPELRVRHRDRPDDEELRCPGPVGEVKVPGLVGEPINPAHPPPPLTLSLRCQRKTQRAGAHYGSPAPTCGFSLVAGVQDHHAPSGSKPDEPAGHSACPMQPPRCCTTQCGRFQVEVLRNPLSLSVLVRPSGYGRRATT